jgi:integrase
VPRKARPKPWAEERRFGTRYVWRFEDAKYRTAFYDDPEEARADAMQQITEQMDGTWRERTRTELPSDPRPGPRILLEEWIDVWVRLLDEIEPTTRAKYKYFVEGHILPEFQGRQLGSLNFEEIEAWEKAIPTRISARGRPYARSVASGARSLLITILGDAVHAGRLERNPAERRKGRRGRVRAKGRQPGRSAQQSSANVITPFQALCLSERCALLSGRDIDFVMNVFAAWTGVRWGELLAVEGWHGDHSPLQISQDGISTYAVDWQLRELGGIVRKSPPKDGSYRTLDLPPFLASLMQWAMDNRRSNCRCPVLDGRAECKGNDETDPNYLFLGPKGGHPRRSNYADDFLTPAAEGLHPARNGTRRPVYVIAEPWPGIPIRKGNWKTRAADVADGTWPNLIGKFRPHDDRHTHATWLDAADLHKVIQMDRRGHAMPGMDAVYNHITLAMRQRLCDVLEQLWRDAVAQRYKLTPRSAVPLLNQILADHGKAASTR